MVFDRIDRGLKPWHVLAFIVIAVGLGAILGLVTGPHLRDVTNGLDTFDIRFNGYTLEEAVELLTALGSDGRSYYATSQLITDFIFAPFLFLAVSSLFLWLTRPGHRFTVPLHENVRLVVVALSFVAFACDWVEDVALWIILGSGEDPASAAVALASTTTGLKWLALAGSLAALAATVIVALIRGASGGETAHA